MFERGDSESGVVRTSEQPGWLVNLRCGHGGEDENENAGKLPSENEDFCDVHRNRADDDMGGSEEEEGSEKADRSVGIDRGNDSGGWVHSDEGEKESVSECDGDFGEGGEEGEGGEGVSLISVGLIDTSSCSASSEGPGGISISSPGFGEEKLLVEISLSSIVPCSISSGGSECVSTMKISVTFWDENANEGEEDEE